MFVDVFGKFLDDFDDLLVRILRGDSGLGGGFGRGLQFGDCGLEVFKCDVERFDGCLKFFLL